MDEGEIEENWRGHTERKKILKGKKDKTGKKNKESQKEGIKKKWFHAVFVNKRRYIFFLK